MVRGAREPRRLPPKKLTGLGILRTDLLVVLSLYIHIPFCEVKCGYCDFFSVPRGHGDFDLQKEYIEQLIQEVLVS